METYGARGNGNVGHHGDKYGQKSTISLQFRVQFSCARQLKKNSDMF